MGVPADDRRESHCSRIEIECLPVVQHIEGLTMEGEHFRGGQVRAGAAHIDVAANGCNGSKLAQRIQNPQGADVSGMQDMFDTAQCFHCLQPE